MKSDRLVLRISNIIEHLKFPFILFIFILQVILSLLLTCALIHAEETLPEGHVERVDRLRLPATLLQISDRFSSTGPATAALLVVAFYSV